MDQQAGATTASPPPVGDAIDLDALSAILRKHEGASRGGLIAILEDVQSEYGYLPEAALRAVAERTGQSLVDVYGVATFYRAFSLRPRGKHLIAACLGTACHVRGAARVVEEIERQLGIRAGETTPDGEFSLETVNCLGACALGPVVVIDGRYFSKMRAPKVKALLERARDGSHEQESGADGRLFPISVSCPRCNHSLMDDACPLDGHPSIRMTVSFDHQLGWVRLSSLYGSPTVLSEHEITQGAEVGFYCPHCHEALDGLSTCPECAASMVPLIVRGGGTVQVCSRRGCTASSLDLV